MDKKLSVQLYLTLSLSMLTPVQPYQKDSKVQGSNAYKPDWNEMYCPCFSGTRPAWWTYHQLKFSQALNKCHKRQQLILQIYICRVQEFISWLWAFLGYYAMHHQMKGWWGSWQHWYCEAAPCCHSTPTAWTSSVGKAAQQCASVPRQHNYYGALHFLANPGWDTFNRTPVRWRTGSTNELLVQLLPRLTSKTGSPTMVWAELI